MVPRLLHPLAEQGGPGEPAGRGQGSAGRALLALPASTPRLLSALFSAGWRTGHLLLPLSSGDSGLGDAIQVLFNVILLLAGGTAPSPCSLLAQLGCQLCSGLLGFATAEKSRVWSHFSRCIYMKVSSALMALFAS